MPKARAYGADAKLLMCRETTYGVSPLSGYRAMDFRSSGLSAEQPIGEDKLLGRGRDARGAYRGLVIDEGAIDVPITVRGIGIWLTAAFGTGSVAQVPATGSFTFSGQPAENSTITLNGVVWTFVTGTPSGNQTQIGGSLSATLTALASNLNASGNAEVSKCNYTVNTSVGMLEIEFKTNGLSGNSYTLASSTSSNATRSAATLLGGGYRHEWLSGADEIPSYTIEIGHPRLTTPMFFRHRGAMVDTFSIDLKSDGTPASAQVQVVAQGETQASATIDANPSQFVLLPFSKARGYIYRGGSSLAGVTGGNLVFSNNLERIRTIRADGLIDAADVTTATCNGDITLYYDGTTLEDVATTGGPVAITYGMTTPTGWSLVFDVFAAAVNRPKRTIEGPGGVMATHQWVGQYDETAATMLRVRLVNDVASYS